MDLTPLFNTEFLRNVLSTVTKQVPDQQFVQHVGSVDSWPALFQKGENAAMIFNTQYDGEPGEHWVAVFVHGNAAFTFDSLPQSFRKFPEPILDKLNKNQLELWHTNSDNLILQHPLFPFCGLYCLAFLDHMIKGKPFELCMENTLVNDVNVVAHMWPIIGQTFFL
jgi:hypothetical protein